MKRKKLLITLAAVLILALGVAVGAVAASSLGTQSDPLVTKSYLDKVLTPQLQSQYQAQLDSQFKDIESEIAGIASSSTGNFTAVSLSSGQVLSASASCEIILRSGSATAVGGLSDITDGAAVSSGSSLSANHLCVAGAAGDGVKASGAVTLLVRGVFNIA